MGNVSDCGKWVFSPSAVLIKGSYLVIVAFDCVYLGRNRAQIVVCLLVADVPCADDLRDLARDLECQVSVLCALE